ELMRRVRETRFPYRGSRGLGLPAAALAALAGLPAPGGRGLARADVIDGPAFLAALLQLARREEVQGGLLRRFQVDPGCIRDCADAWAWVRLAMGRDLREGLGDARRTRAAALRATGTAGGATGPAGAAACGGSAVPEHVLERFERGLPDEEIELLDECCYTI